MSDREADEQTEERGRIGAILREIAGLVGGAYLLVLVATIAAPYIPFVGGSLYLIVALVFIYLPYWWLERNEWKFSRFGLTTDHFWRNVGWGLLLTLVTAGPFAAGYYVWETEFVGASYEFEWSNFNRWDPQLRGRPANWGTSPGVWTWTREREVHVGIRAGREVPVTVEFRAERPFRVRKVGPVQLQPVEPAAEGAEEATKWRATLWREHKRAELTIAPKGSGTSSFPTRLDVEIVEATGAYDLHVGSNGSVASRGSHTFERGLRWVYLWLMTQIAFVALPEEFFYRGYLQTRIGEALEAYRTDDETDGETKSWLGISEQNVLASLAFGIGHLLIPVNGRLLLNRISVAFPSVVFGWLRERTDTITAPVVYHAGCNMLVLLAEPHFF